MPAPSVEMNEVHIAMPPNFYSDSGYKVRLFTPGFIANSIAFVFMAYGFFARYMESRDPDFFPDWLDTVNEYFLAFGLFGFAGGVTNWLAIKMLFDKIPFIYGSGVIPARFKEIRKSVKDAIMRTFFDQKYLEKYLSKKAGAILGGLNVEEKIRQLLESPVVDDIIDAKLKEFSQRPEAVFITLMGIQPNQLKTWIKPFALGLGGDLAPLVSQLFEPGKTLNLDSIRRELDVLMTAKLEELTPEIVKRMLEDVMREQLGLLIVWGTFFGGMIGVLSALLGY
ncbi:hypothetical protein RCL1_002682 [Eukaryota sp. TZLM3-RCL]